MLNIDGGIGYTYSYKVISSILIGILRMRLSVARAKIKDGLTRSIEFKSNK